MNYLERKVDQFILWGQKVRAVMLEPLFSLLTACKLRAGHLTFARLIGLALFFYLFLHEPVWAVIALFAATVIDWFDGGLALYQKRASDRGKFWDILVDHVLYVGAIFTLIYWGAAHPIWASYHLFITPILFLLATVAVSEEKKTDWIIHPYYRIIYLKPVGMIALLFYVFWGMDFIDRAIYVLNIVMTLLTLYYTWVLIQRWDHAEKTD